MYTLVLSNRKSIRVSDNDVMPSARRPFKLSAKQIKHHTQVSRTMHWVCEKQEIEYEIVVSPVLWRRPSAGVGEEILYDVLS